MKDTHKFQVFADYHQFYLMDAGIDLPGVNYLGRSTSIILAGGSEA